MPTAEDRKKNIERVYEAATQCFLEMGIHATQQKDIAERAGLTTRSLQRYFPSKDAMLLAVSKKLIYEHCIELLKAFENYNREPHTGLEQTLFWLQLHFPLVGEYAQKLLLLIEIDIYLKRQKILSSEIIHEIPVITKTTAVLQSTIEKGIQDGSIKEHLDPQWERTMISTTFIGLIQRIVILGENRFESEYGCPPKDIIDAYLMSLKSTLIRTH